MRLPIMAASLLCLAGAAAAQPAPFDALSASSAIVNHLAHQDLDAAAEATARLMETMPRQARERASVCCTPGTR